MTGGDLESNSGAHMSNAIQLAGGMNTSAAVGVGDAASANKSFDRDAAERTIGRITKKLQGYEDSASEAFSVEGQVEFVVHEAQDPSNLSKIYYGWAPWM
jgi:hypothetical protein